MSERDVVRPAEFKLSRCYSNIVCDGIRISIAAFHEAAAQRRSRLGEHCGCQSILATRQTSASWLRRAHFLQEGLGQPDRILLFCCENGKLCIPRRQATISPTSSSIMGKYLRYLAVHPDAAVLAVLHHDTDHLCWMYEHYATPFPTDGITKVNIWLSGEPGPYKPTECLGIADARVHFDVAHYSLLLNSERSRYFLDRLHSALVNCAHQFGWGPTALEDARTRMPDDGRPFMIPVGKPVLGPDRKLRAQGLIEAAPQTRIWLQFTDRGGTELSRALLSAIRAGSRSQFSAFRFREHPCKSSSLPETATGSPWSRRCGTYSPAHRAP
jgi:hypothetical protein